jgi:hypothetical protein
MAGGDSSFGEGGGDLRLLCLQNIHVHFFAWCHENAISLCSPNTQGPFHFFEETVTNTQHKEFLHRLQSTGVNASAKIVFIFIDEKSFDLLHHSGDLR